METKKELSFKLMPDLLSRISPFIITEINNPVNEPLLQKALAGMGPYVTLEHIETPKKLFDFLKEHKKELIVIKDDLFTKRKNYLDIVRGAVCSSPDSMELWSVYYLNEKEFVFNGKIILCTTKTKEEIKSDKRFFYFDRDCLFI